MSLCVCAFHGAVCVHQKSKSWLCFSLHSWKCVWKVAQTWNLETLNQRLASRQRWDLMKYKYFFFFFRYLCFTWLFLFSSNFSLLFPKFVYKHLYFLLLSLRKSLLLLCLKNTNTIRSNYFIYYCCSCSTWSDLNCSSIQSRSLFRERDYFQGP